MAKSSGGSTEGFDVEAKLIELKKGNSDPFRYVRDNLSQIIEVGGIDGAIGLSEKAIQSKMIDMSNCHVLLHGIGHLAYEYFDKDLNKLSRFDSKICQAAFQHGVEAQITQIEKEPYEILKLYCETLRKVIPGIYCYHGAGHAFMQMSNDANVALVNCDKLAGGPEKDLGDCYRGIFSEYGNRALNYDGDTGLIFPGEPLVKLDFQRPYDFCLEFDKQYQNSCFSQLTKVVYRGPDIDGSIKECLKKDYSSEIQETCVKIIAAIHIQQVLSRQDQFAPPSLILQLSENLRQAFIFGAREAFTSFIQTDIEKDWSGFCGEFESGDREFCDSLL